MGEDKDTLGGGIIGVRLGRSNYDGVQDAREAYKMTENEVMERCVSVGLGLFQAKAEGSLRDEGMYKVIEQHAAELDLPEYAIVVGAVREGLDQFLRRSYRARDAETLRQTRGALGLDEEDRPLAGPNEPKDLGETS